jgi:NAD(P)-dependent dehydrogenase (short-subunit alcohol dehydrogenase family)
MGPHQNQALPTANREFAEQVFVVTGAAQGLGRTIAETAASRGAAVVLCDVNEVKVRATATEIGDLHGAKTLAIACDVRNLDAWADLVDRAKQTFGRIDHLVNGAGTLEVGAVVDTDPDAFRRLFDVNVTGTFLGMRAVIPTLLEQQSGSIINISSMCGKKGMPELAAYCASKAAVISLTQSTALEVSPHVRVNAVCPGVVDTEMQQREYELVSAKTGQTPAQIRDEWISGVPLKRLQEPSDIADAVCFLASGYARNITGESLNVNGGLLMD